MVDPEVARLIRSAREAWLRHHPVAASLWNEPVWSAAEDLSDKGLEAWIETLGRLQSSIDYQRSRNVSPISAAALSELQRFVNEQNLRHVYQAIYRTQARSYLQLCAFALLPFWLQLQAEPTLDAEMHSHLEYRARKCIEWLHEAQKRMGTAELSYTAKDKTIVSQLIGTLVDSKQFASEPVGSLLEQLDRWTHLPLLECEPSTPQVGLRWYLKSVLQVELSETVLLETLLARIEVELSELKRVLDQQLPVSNVDRANADLLEYMAEIESDLRESVPNTMLHSVGARATISLAPRFLSTFVEDAIYLPSTITGKRSETGGWLLINPNASTPNNGPIPVQLKSYLAMVLAHELVPGHGEHLHRAASSPLSELFTFTRSQVGLEGWGFCAEGAILRLDKLASLAARTVGVHKLRRLTAAAQFLCKAPSHAKHSQDLANILSTLPRKERDLIVVPHTSTVQMLCYALGLIETERSLAEVSKQTNTTSSPQTTIEHYLSWGPLAPKTIVDLTKDVLMH